MVVCHSFCNCSVFGRNGLIFGKSKNGARSSQQSQDQPIAPREANRSKSPKSLFNMGAEDLFAPIRKSKRYGFSESDVAAATGIAPPADVPKGPLSRKFTIRLTSDNIAPRVATS